MKLPINSSSKYEELISKVVKSIKLKATELQAKDLALLSWSLCQLGTKDRAYHLMIRDMSADVV